MDRRFPAYGLLYVLSGITIAAILAVIVLNYKQPCIVYESLLSTTPWRCIGGCGMGGYGGGDNSAVRWVGKGVQGYILSAEIMPRFSSGADYFSNVFNARLILNPARNTEIALSFPLVYTIAEARYSENLPVEMHINNGPGDISLEFNRIFGSGGIFSSGLSLTFPTGKYDEIRGPKHAGKILPNRLQTGRGLYDASVRFGWCPTFENSIMLLEASFNYPFNIRLDKKNEYLETDYRAYQDATVNRGRFYYSRIIKPYGENDRGDYYPPLVKLDAVYGFYHQTTIVHSVQISFSAPLGTAWIHNWDPTRYDPYPDPEHHAWQILLFYGVEMSQMRFPFFIGAGIPIKDKKGSDNRWDGVDTEDFLREWVFVAGVKIGFF